MPKKLGFLATHPIQYYSPLFYYLAQKKDLDVTVYYCHKPTPEQQGAGFGVPFEWDKDLLSGYRHIFLSNVSKRPGISNFFGCDTPEIDEIIRRQKFDSFIIMGWDKRSYWQAIKACGRAGTLLMVRGDSQLSRRTPAVKLLAKRIIYPCFMRRFHACLAVGLRSEEYFRYYGAKRVVRSPHFVDNEWFERESQKSLEPRSGPIFLFSGKFEEKKHPMDYLKALEKLKQDSTAPIRAVMAGDGVLREKCEQFAKDKKLDVHFTGFVNQSAMPKIYASADVLVLTSDDRETWGLVVNEAMACGLPVIVSEEAGSAPDLVSHGNTGFIFPCGDVEKLASYMQKFRQDRSLAISMGCQARVYIKDFSVARAAAGILQAAGGL